MNDFHQTYVRLRSQPSGDWLVHPKMRDRLVKYAAKRDTNLTEAAIEILSARYGIDYEATGRKTGPRDSADVLNMRLPSGLWEQIRYAAVESGHGNMDEVRVALCEHFNLKIPKRK